MPPRMQVLRPGALPDWSSLLLPRTPAPARVKAPGAPSARRGPATLGEALSRFVERNWD